MDFFKSNVMYKLGFNPFSLLKMRQLDILPIPAIQMICVHIVFSCKFNEIKCYNELLIRSNIMLFNGC